MATESTRANCREKTIQGVYKCQHLIDKVILGDGAQNKAQKQLELTLSQSHETGSKKDKCMRLDSFIMHKRLPVDQLNNLRLQLLRV